MLGKWVFLSEGASERLKLKNCVCVCVVMEKSKAELASEGGCCLEVTACRHLLCCCLDYLPLFLFSSFIKTWKNGQLEC